MQANSKQPLIKLNEFERKLHIKDYEAIEALMRSLHKREYAMVYSLPNIKNHNKKIEDYENSLVQYGKVSETAQGRKVLRSQEPIALDRVEFMWTIGLTSDAYIAFVALTGMGDVHRIVSNAFAIFKSFRNEFSARAIVVHTHPAAIGVPKPSPNDVKFTKSLLYAARNLSIQLHDHIILGPNNLYSFMQNDKMDYLDQLLDIELTDKEELLENQRYLIEEKEKAIMEKELTLKLSQQKDDEIAKLKAQLALLNKGNKAP